MHQITGREIEKRAVMEVIYFFEPQIDAIIKQSIIELDKLNKLKHIQGLNPKVRIDHDCIQNAIKTLKPNDDNISLSVGGERQKIGEKNEKHMPKEEKQGVEII